MKTTSCEGLPVDTRQSWGYPALMSGFTARSRSIRPFLAMEVFERAQALEREGRSVLHLEVGEPDFPPPPAAVEAAVRALAAGETRYTDSRGLPSLREAIARDKGARAGVEIDPGRVLTTNGTSPALLLTCSLLIEAGDEVLIPSPHYPCYPSFVQFCGGQPVFVPTRAEDGYRVDPAALEAGSTAKTRAILLGTPANPTGAVQDASTLRALATLGVPLISDEIYDGLLYDGAATASALAASPDAYVLDGFSKRYAMTGFRLGYVIAPEASARTLQVLQQNLFISTNHFVQRAGEAALAQGRATASEMQRVYARRRRRLIDGLRTLGFGIPVEPEGAFYVFADARRFDSDSQRLAFRLLEEAGVAVTPGVDFGEAGEGHLRFCYAVADETIDQALERLERALRRAP